MQQNAQFRCTIAYLHIIKNYARNRTILQVEG
jgi:hypothetical protein